MNMYIYIHHEDNLFIILMRQIWTRTLIKMVDRTPHHELGLAVWVPIKRVV